MEVAAVDDAYFDRRVPQRFSDIKPAKASTCDDHPMSLFHNSWMFCAVGGIPPSYTGIQRCFCFILPVRKHTEQTMTQGTVQLVAGILALILVGIIIMRRKGKKKEEDDF